MFDECHLLSNRDRFALWTNSRYRFSVEHFILHCVKPSILFRSQIKCQMLSVCSASPKKTKPMTIKKRIPSYDDHVIFGKWVGGVNSDITQKSSIRCVCFSFCVRIYWLSGNIKWLRISLILWMLTQYSWSFFYGSFRCTDPMSCRCCFCHIHTRIDYMRHCLSNGYVAEGGKADEFKRDSNGFEITKWIVAASSEQKQTLLLSSLSPTCLMNVFYALWHIKWINGRIYFFASILRFVFFRSWLSHFYATAVNNSSNSVLFSSNTWCAQDWIGNWFEKRNCRYETKWLRQCVSQSKIKKRDVAFPNWAYALEPSFVFLCQL